MCLTLLKEKFRTSKRLRDFGLFAFFRFIILLPVYLLNSGVLSYFRFIILLAVYLLNTCVLSYFRFISFIQFIVLLPVYYFTCLRPVYYLTFCLYSYSQFSFLLPVHVLFPVYFLAVQSLSDFFSNFPIFSFSYPGIILESKDMKPGNEAVLAENCFY